MKKIKTRHGFLFRKIIALGRVIKKKPKIYNLNDEEVLEHSIIISNHSAASGPLTLSLFFPKFFVPWGTHEMTENYVNRWKYLYHIFYQQKIGYGKVKAFILATLFAIISKLLYNGMQLIPTYTDLRFKQTIESSLNHLEKNNSILVFPEDSAFGYHEKLTKYNAGFVYLSEKYYQKHGIDLPIYPIYYHKVLGSLIIGKKEYIKPLLDKGMNRYEIANYFKDLTNELADKLFSLERSKEGYSERKIFKGRLLNKLKNIREKHLDLSLSDFKISQKEESDYMLLKTRKQIMKQLMGKNDLILAESTGEQNINLKIRYFRR